MVDGGKIAEGAERGVGVQPLLIKIDGAAQLLGCSRSQVYTLVARGEIPYVRLGKCIRFSREMLQEWLKQSTVHPDPYATAKGLQMGAAGRW